MLTWDDLDLSVNEGDSGIYRERRVRIPVPQKRKMKVVKKQENRITESTPVPQTKSDKSTLPDDKIIGSDKGKIAIVPIMEGVSGVDASGINKGTMIIPNLMLPTVEPKKVVNPKDWTRPLYKDKFIILTVIGLTVGLLIAKKYNKNLLFAGVIGAGVGVVLANIELAINNKDNKLA